MRKVRLDIHTDRICREKRKKREWNRFFFSADMAMEPCKTKKKKRV